MVYAHPYFQLANPSRMLEKALCYIQLANVGDGPTAHGSLHQIRGAANAIIIGCVADAVGCGGIATNIGKFAR